MKPKTVLTTILLLFVGVSVAYLVVNELQKDAGGNVTAERKTGNATAEAGPNERAASTTANTGREVVAYYFHRDLRCSTCRKIEAYSSEAILEEFADELDDGRLEFVVINLDDPGNEHFVDDYELYSPALVLADFQNGEQTRWKNLDDVWILTDDKDKFLAYVREEMKDYLRGDG